MDKSAAILIVDDYQLIRSAVRDVLSELGFRNVIQAENGMAAQELMCKQPIDIVIGDWSMPFMSGLDLIKWMRSDRRYQRVPFMMLTGEAGAASVRTALQAGVNAYMIKPFTVHSFASKFMAMVGPLRDASCDGEPAAARMAMPEPLARHELVAPAAPAHVIGLAPSLAERLKKCTVLIVDDIPTNIEVMAGVLKDDYTIKVAISGKKAIEIANAFNIDLILLDIMMPVMDGFEVCRRLKVNPKTAHIPIIFLSARDGVDDVVSGLKMGAVDYVSKPADPTILKARLSAHLTLSTVLADLKRQNALLVENAHLREDVERMTRHDLKSPIAVALQSSQSLLAGDLDTQQRASAEMIQMAASNALEMVNRTLDVYKMEMGQYQPVLEAFDLASLLDRAARQTEVAFGWKKIRVILTDLGMGHCMGEPLLCYSLLTNLLKNAAEASPEGGLISIDGQRSVAGIAVVIGNQGEVPAALHDTFFDKYATANKVGGSGLGTYSVRLMAEVQGGGVGMQSNDGQTRITVTLAGTNNGGAHEQA
jgi:two-component system sensor histidine kinase/response regulator